MHAALTSSSGFSELDLGEAVASSSSWEGGRIGDGHDVGEGYCSKFCPWEVVVCEAGEIGD